MIWIYDIEVAKNFYSNIFYSYDGETKLIFEFSSRRNDLPKLIKFYKEMNARKDYLIGFNSLHYDSVVDNFILKNPSCSNMDIWRISQAIIDDNYHLTKPYKYLPYGYKNIQLVDLACMWTQKTRMANKISLKSLAGQMGWYWLQELVFDPLQPIEESKFDEVLEYQHNDVQITLELAKRFKSKLNSRVRTQRRTGLKCLSKDDVNLGCDLLLLRYAEAIGSTPKEVKARGNTVRGEIDMSEVIFDYIKFNDFYGEVRPLKTKDDVTSYGAKSFGAFFNHLKSRTVYQTNEVKYTVLYKGVKIDYGSGGIHGYSNKINIQPKSDEVIIDLDVTSYYPYIPIKNVFYPLHLGPEYLEVYSGIVEERVIAKPVDKERADELKLSINGAFGNYNQEFSWLRDIMMTFKSTINGQLLLSMLAEMITEIGGWVFTLNTDGLTTLLKKKDLDKFREVYRKWEEITRLNLEEQELERVIQTNVNNYIWLYKDHEGKLKGKVKGAEFRTKPNLGEASDFMVIPKALSAYFIEGIRPEEFIKNHTQWEDFFACPKVAKNFKVLFDNKVLPQRLNRVYACTNGKYLYKKKEGGNPQHMFKGIKVCLMNMWDKEKPKPKNINYNFYISKAYETINKAESSSLF